MTGRSELNKKNIMVCVTQQKTCEKLIKKGVSLRDRFEDLFIINVVKENESFLHKSSEPDALEYLFSIAREVEADLTVIRDDDVTKALADYAVENDVGCIVLGVSPNGKDEESHPIVKDLKKKIKNKKPEFVVV